MRRSSPFLTEPSLPSRQRDQAPPHLRVPGLQPNVQQSLHSGHALPPVDPRLTKGVEDVDSAVWLLVQPTTNRRLSVRIVGRRYGSASGPTVLPP